MTIKKLLTDSGALRASMGVYGVAIPAGVLIPKKPHVIVPAGATILFSDGCYSSYGVTALAKALKDLDLVALRACWNATKPPAPDSHSPFVAWLCQLELIEEIGYFEAWHDDGDFDVTDRR